MKELKRLIKEAESFQELRMIEEKERNNDIRNQKRKERYKKLSNMIRNSKNNKRNEIINLYTPENMQYYEYIMESLKSWSKGT
jgi:ureidoglycolate hydrolase